MRTLPAVLFLIFLFVDPMSALGAASEEQVSSRTNAQALKQHYDTFVASLNHRQLAEEPTHESHG